MDKLKFTHPFLFALYPVLFLYAYNINYFKENVLIVPLLFSLVFSALIFLICQLITKRIDVSAVISSLLILVFFSYSKIREPLKSIQFNLGNIDIGPDEIIWVCILILLSVTIFLILSHKRRLRYINKALGILSLILLITAVGNTVVSEIKIGRISFADLTGNTEELHDTGIPQETPDIYYFILDRYAGDKTLENYGFNNSSFINFLKSKGFYIASDSTSNYPKTFLSLSSTLNMDYLDFLTQKTNGGATSDESIVTPLVQNNKVMQFLKSRGYAYLHIGSGWDPTRSNPYADRNFVMNGGRYPFADEFTSGFLQTTLASSILKKLYPDATAVSQDPKNNEFRSRIFYEFSVFDEIPEMDSPKFVFAHILVPHDPYVLGKDCEPLVEGTVISRKDTENYLNQLQCANQKTVDAIETILANSRTKPIIIVQSDEGPLPIVNKISTNLDWKNAGNASLEEKFPILNAFLLPGFNSNTLYPSITPVNSFRVIFNNYFGTNLPLLPDKNIIFEDDKNLYKFIDVTDRLKGDASSQ